MSSEAPYASVIVPTHDRAATLDLTINSIRAQSVADIEIILALDGATAEVRAVAQSLAPSDPRIVVLDLPKGPGRGSANRDIALERSRASRIFYSDDDDLWLPEHVATLGPLLDDAEVAYSPVLSLAPSGALHSALIDYNLPNLKRLLGAGKLKLTFDTHFAHRRHTYFERGRPWAVDVERPVYNLLTALTAPEIAWRAADAPTALSIHGAPRKHWGPDKRRDELRDWSEKLSAQGALRLQRTSRVDWYLLRALRDYPPHKDETLSNYATRLGFDLANAPLTDEQRVSMAAVFDLFQGRAPDRGVLASALPHLLEPLLGGSPSVVRLGDMVVAAMGAAPALALVREAPPRNSIRRTLCTMLEAYLIWKSGDRATADAMLMQTDARSFPGAATALRAYFASAEAADPGVE